jgi:hypothetical protein
MLGEIGVICGFFFLSVTESETQPNFVRPNPLQLLGIAWSKDAQTSAQKDLFQAVQPGQSYGGGHAQTRR